MKLANALKHLFPNADPLRDWIVQDDGTGAYIAAWHLPTPQPTPEQLQAASDAQESQEAQDAQAAAQLRQRIRTVALSSVGVAADQLTATQLRAIVIVLLRKAGALDADMKIRPFAEWDV